MSEGNLMTTPTTHRAPARPQPEGGVIPAGSVRIWAVAWRQHRTTVAVLGGIMLAAALALVWLRYRIVSLFNEFGCELFPDPSMPMNFCADHDGNSVWWNYGLSTFSDAAHLGMIAGPVALGVFTAGSLFTREFGRGTHVFALTQGVSRSRWFTAKVTVVLVPLVVGLLALGYLMDWVDSAVGMTAHGALRSDMIMSKVFVPAAMALAAFALTIAVGMFVRASVATLVVGLIAGFALLAGVALVQQYLLPADRVSVRLEVQYAPISQAEFDARMNGNGTWAGDPNLGPDDLMVTGGYLNAQGAPVKLGNDAFMPCYNASGEAVQRAEQQAAAQGISADEFYQSAASTNVDNEVMLTCLNAMGLDAQYYDYLPARMLWPMRWVVTGLLVLLSAVFLGVGAWRLRWAVAKR